MASSSNKSGKAANNKSGLEQILATGANTMPAPAPQLAPAASLLVQPGAATPDIPAPMPMQGTGQMAADSSIGGNAVMDLLGLSRPTEEAPPDNPYTKMDDPAQPIEVQGDSWQPEKVDLLRRIADAVLVAKGRDPIAAPRIKEQNMAAAMQGFQSDPEQAIRRAAQVDQEGAAKMWEAYSRVRQNDAQTEQAQAKTYKDSSDTITGMLSGLPVDEKEAAIIYDQFRPLMGRMWDAAGGKSEFLPEKFDPQAIRLISRMGLSAYQDLQAREAERHNQATEALTAGNYESLAEDRTGRRAETTRHNTAVEGQDVAEEGGRNTRAADAEAGRDRRSPAKRRPPPFSPRRKGDRVQGPDGSTWTSQDGKTWR